VGSPHPSVIQIVPNPKYEMHWFSHCEVCVGQTVVVVGRTSTVLQPQLTVAGTGSFGQ
jgi:hypothetical protein